MRSVYLYPTTKDDFEDYYMVRSDPADVYWNGFSTPPEKRKAHDVHIITNSKIDFSKGDL